MPTGQPRLRAAPECKLALGLVRQRSLRAGRNACTEPCRPSTGAPGSSLQLERSWIRRAAQQYAGSRLQRRWSWFRKSPQGLGSVATKGAIPAPISSSAPAAGARSTPSRPTSSCASSSRRAPGTARAVSHAVAQGLAHYKRHGALSRGAMSGTRRRTLEAARATARRSSNLRDSAACVGGLATRVRRQRK